MVKKLYFILIILIGVVVMGACASSRTYLLNLRYDSAQTPRFVKETSPPIKIALYNFQDVRPDRLYLGRRVYRDGMVDFFKPDEGTVEQIVTKLVANMMTKAGFQVTLVNRYLDPEKEDFQHIPGDLALGGKIENLWIEAKTGIATTNSEVKIRLQAHWGIVSDRTWLSKNIEGSALETDRPLYQPRHAEAKINEVLKDALDKLLKDENRLQEKIEKLKK
ncbi:MAG: hypothetical protein ACPL5I_14365 [Thermodesulfobacteriota bacterium]